MAYIGNTLGTIFTQTSRIHYLTDTTSSTFDLLSSFDLAGGELEPSSTPTDAFGTSLTVDSFDNNDLGHILTMDLGTIS